MTALIPNMGPYGAAENAAPTIVKNHQAAFSSLNDDFKTLVAMSKSPSDLTLQELAMKNALLELRVEILENIVKGLSKNDTET